VSRPSADVVICGAGIAGASAAYHLSVKRGIDRLLVVDPRPPLTLTSDKSTECYRNWWPNQPMVELMNRSIDLLEDLAHETGNAFGLNRRGYLYATADPERLQRMSAQAEETAALGGGVLRVHEGGDGYRPSDSHGFDRALDGADLLDADALRTHFPYLTRAAVGALHVRRAGWFSAQGLGALMLERAGEAGAEMVKGSVSSVETTGGAVTGVTLGDGSTIATDCFINAAGPYLGSVGKMVGVDLPVLAEIHQKLGFRDHLRALPREAPMVIWSDSQELDWTAEERAGLEAEGRTDLLGRMPVFCHGRPEGGLDSQYVLALWEYHRQIMGDPVFPLPLDPLYPEVVIKGMSTMIPAMTAYAESLPTPTVDGGYYLKTEENRPLIGPCGPPGSHVIGAFSGFGVMVAAGAGDLLAGHIVGDVLPDYAPAFSLSRYDDPAYLAEANANDSGQL
jgi:glycine/D-amino acid oxidase-like deaminating enzyme